MKIIIRACGERTEKRCIQLAEKEGDVHVIRAFPFGESIRQTYKLAMTFDEKWVCVVDADVQLYPGMLQKGINELNKLRGNVLCLDGKTDDKIFQQARRAGIHIYRTNLLEKAIKFIDNKHIKPETQIRREMTALGYKTHTSRLVFGKHDYDQFYCDLWRKAICQTQKLARKIRNKPLMWAKKAKTDKDFIVILNGHVYGKKFKSKIVIDKRKDFNAKMFITRLGLREKGELR